MHASDLLKSLQDRIQETERRTLQAAGEYRQAIRRDGEKDPRPVDRRTALARLVEASFEHRQQAQEVQGPADGLPARC